MPAYDADLFDPPAPLARVALRNPENDAILSDVPMLLDTGADAPSSPFVGVVFGTLGSVLSQGIVGAAYAPGWAAQNHRL
jgi:hypothetical protein